MKLAAILTQLVDYVGTAGNSRVCCFFSDYLGLELSDTVLEHIGWVGEVADDVASMQQVSSGRLLFTVIGIEGGNVFTVSSSLEGVFFLIVVIQRPGYSGSVLSSLGSLLASLRDCMVLS